MGIVRSCRTCGPRGTLSAVVCSRYKASSWSLPALIATGCGADWSGLEVADDGPKWWQTGVCVCCVCQAEVVLCVWTGECVVVSCSLSAMMTSMAGPGVLTVEIKPPRHQGLHRSRQTTYKGSLAALGNHRGWPFPSLCSSSSMSQRC